MEGTSVASMDSTSVDRLRESVRGTRGWLNFLGILMIISGGLTAITIVGILFAWLPIWLGVLLVQAASRGREFVDRATPAELIAYNDKLKSYFTIVGWMTIISFALSILTAIIMFIVFLVAGTGFMQSFLPMIAR